MQHVLMVLFLICCVLLILLILVQRGKGGGLAGAFGGAGGQSAFGTKTADILTKVTAGLAIVFFLLSIVTAKMMNPNDEAGSIAPTSTTSPATGAGDADVDDADAGAGPAGTVEVVPATTEPANEAAEDNGDTKPDQAEDDTSDE